MDDLIVGIGIALVLEGLLYAAFPDQAKNMLAQFLQMPPSILRLGGLCALASGVLLVWLIRG